MRPCWYVETCLHRKIGDKNWLCLVESENLAAKRRDQVGSCIGPTAAVDREPGISSTEMGLKG